MSNWKDSEDETISLDDLKSMEYEEEHRDDPCYNEDDWGESYDDFDSEVWERQYGKEDLEVEPDSQDLG